MTYYHLTVRVPSGSIKEYNAVNSVIPIRYYENDAADFYIAEKPDDYPLEDWYKNTIMISVEEVQ